MQFTRSLVSLCAASLVFSSSVWPQSGDRVDGNLILFNDNGAWCWFQDERVVVHVNGGRIVLASVADIEGVGGELREGDIDVTAFDLATGSRTRFTLHSRLISYGTGDDHNTPALWVRPDGRYLAMYAGHDNDYFSRYRTTLEPNDISQWGVERLFDWNAEIPGGSDHTVTYSNLYFLKNENRLYNFSRADNRGPNIMISEDHGSSWQYGGKLTYTPVGVGYVNGYLRYASDGAERIHFIATEHHPRDFNNSLYHGYIQDGKSFDSAGNLIDPNIFDEDAPLPNHFTPVFQANSILGGNRITHAWTVDLRIDGEGFPFAIFSARVNSDHSDHRFFYARFDGDRWHAHELAKAGPGLDEREEDYIGLAAIDPDAPHTLYISTPIDPRDDSSLASYEIFRGETHNGGETWVWQPITEDSEVNNLRPVVPRWNASETAVLWFRGRYVWQHEFDTAIVGVVRRSGETIERASYVAGADHTTLADGTPLTDAASDRSVGGWRMGSGIGKEGTVLASGEEGMDEALDLLTESTVEFEGIYDVWVLFWADPEQDWRVRAGFSSDRMTLFRQKAAQSVQQEHFNAPMTLETEAGQRLYRGYVGRVPLAAGESFSLYVGGAATQNDGSQRTWYDGVAIARIHQNRD